MRAAGGARPSRVPNPRGQGGRLRHELAAAALRLLDAGGVETLTLRAVARETGVAAPSIYRQFSDIQALIAEVARQCFLELGDEMVARRDEVQDPEARLLACCRAYVDFARRYPHRYALLFRDTNLAGTERQEADQAGAAVFEILLAAVVACTGESADAAIMTAAAVWSGVDGYGRLRTHRAHFAWPEQETMLRRIIGDHIGRGSAPPLEAPGSHAGGVPTDRSPR